MDYETGLLEVKSLLPFDDWKLKFELMEQYTDENCEAAKLILNTLLSDLIALGEGASEEEKLQKFQVAVEALNDLNDETDGTLIETGEREELCELFCVIATRAGLDPKQYGDGEGPASEWRDW